MYSESIDAGVGRVAVVAFDSQLYDVVCDGVADASDVRCLGVFDGEVLDGGAVAVVHVVAE